MAKRRPNPLKTPPRNRSKAPVEGWNVFANVATVFLETLLFGKDYVRPEGIPGNRLFRCSKCGFTMQIMGNLQIPRVCPMGCGKTFVEQSPAVPPKPRVPKMSREEAARMIAHYACVNPAKPHAGDDCPSFADVQFASRDKVRFWYRRGAAKLHPDNKETGNHDLFVKLQEAMEVLEG